MNTNREEDFQIYTIVPLMTHTSTFSNFSRYNKKESAQKQTFPRKFLIEIAHEMLEK